MLGSELPLLGGLYLAIIRDRYGGSQTALNIALSGGFFLAIKMDRYGGPRTLLNIPLLEAST
jgi:hypothetical protein